MVNSALPLHHLLGAVLARLGELEKAEAALRTALVLAPENTAAMEMLGRVISHTRARIGEGSLIIARARELRKQLKQQRAQPAASPASAVTTLETPVMDQSAPPRSADRSQVVTIVAGLPRSGTSMMMQMLAAAGITPFTDARRRQPTRLLG